MGSGQYTASRGEIVPLLVLKHRWDQLLNLSKNIRDGPNAERPRGPN